MSRRQEITNWLTNTSQQRHHVTDYILTLEIENEALRRRNGELRILLSTTNTGINDAQPRHQLIKNTLTNAIELVTSPTSRTLADLHEAVHTLQNLRTTTDQTQTAS